CRLCSWLSRDVRSPRGPREGPSRVRNGKGWAAGFSAGSPVELEDIVYHADQAPLSAHFREPSQGERADSQDLFDVTDRCLHDRLPLAVRLGASLGGE